TVDVVLDRIFHGHDVLGVVVQALERGIERGGLAGAGGTGDQNDAVRLVDELIHGGLGVRIHAEGVQVEPACLLVENTQHHALAVPGGDGRYAYVDRTAGDFQADAAILRQALLGDVEARHDLHARHHERRNRAARLQHLAQHAIDAEADHQAV